MIRFKFLQKSYFNKILLPLFFFCIYCLLLTIPLTQAHAQTNYFNSESKIITILREQIQQLQKQIAAIRLMQAASEKPLVSTGDSLQSKIFTTRAKTDTLTLNIAGNLRTITYHVPSGYTVGKKYPLLLLFHGGNGNGKNILEQTKFVEKAEAKGFIVIAPNGINKNWNDGRGTTDAELAGVDDVAFVRELIKVAKNELSIDSSRVYATGISNGGMFTQRLGCELSDVLAAIAPVVGPMPSKIVQTCKGDDISVIGIQGTLDPFIPIDGGDTKHKKWGIGDGGQVESAEETMQFWAIQNGCKETQQKYKELRVFINDGTSVDKYTYIRCDSKAVVEYYIVNGMGHVWPPQIGTSGVSGPSSKNINATDIIWDFFKAQK